LQQHEIKVRRAATMHSGPNNVIQMGCAHLSAAEKEARTQILTVSDSGSGESLVPSQIAHTAALSAAWMMPLHYSSLSVHS
jgi:hypothetical protein